MGRIKKFSMACCVILLLSIIGCGSDTESTLSNIDAGNTNGESSGYITVTGILQTASLQTAALETDTDEGIRIGAAKEGSGDELTVVVIDNESNQTYSTTTSPGEEFSLEVPSESTYLVSIINDGSYVGPAVFDGSDSEVNTAITPSSDTELGSITVDTSSGYAMTSSVPDSVDDAVTAVATNGVPVGAGNDGKIQNDDITIRSDSDEDMDGIPNIFDADEDNDGIRDGIISMPSSAAVVSDVVESVHMDSNIWANHGTTSGAEDLIALRLHVVPQNGQESLISGVQCIDVPSSIEDVATVRWAGSLGDPVDYPAENSLWQDDTYNLYQTTTLTTEEWIVSIAPNAIMNVGDTFTIRVTYTDSTYEDFFVSTSYVLTDWARIASYNQTAMPTSEGTSDTPVTFSEDTLEVVITKIKDEDGNILEGLVYSLRYGESAYDASAERYLVPSAVTEAPVTDTGGATLTHTITTTDIMTYYVTPVAESADGQRNGEETWFKRE